MMNGPDNLKKHPADRDPAAAARNQAARGTEPVELIRKLLAQSGVAKRTS
jgi:hypothetical protein